jgi:hypothetical protein
VDRRNLRLFDWLLTFLFLIRLYHAPITNWCRYRLLSFLTSFAFVVYNQLNLFVVVGNETLSVSLTNTEDPRNLTVSKALEYVMEVGRVLGLESVLFVNAPE